MRSPDTAKATVDEIVASIVEELRPWQPQHRQIETGELAGHKVEKTEAEARAEITSTVRHEIEHLRDIRPQYLSREAIREVRAGARRIIAAIDTLE